MMNAQQFQIAPQQPVNSDEVRMPIGEDMIPEEIRYRYDQLVKIGDSALALQECRDALWECASDPSSTPDELLQIAKRIPAIEFLLKQDARIRERYTIEEHTSMVLAQLDKYLSDPKVDCLLSHAELRIAALFHDIGKSLPDLKSDQHLGTLQVLETFDAVLPLSEQSKQILCSLIANDPIGRFVVSSVATFATAEERQEIIARSQQELLSGKEIKVFADRVQFAQTTLEHIEKGMRVAEEIATRAEALGISAEGLINLHTLFYGADTSAYTYDAVAANGRRAYPGLDFLFALNEGYEVTSGQQLLSRNSTTGLMQFSAGAWEKIGLIHL